MALLRTRACVLGRTAPYAALGLVLIWHPSWIFTAFFAALFAALALNFPGRRKRQLDAIGVDRELSKGSFVAKGDARRDPDRPVHGDDDGDGDDDDDGGDDANFVAKLEHQYHDFVDMIMYTEHVFNEVSVVLEQGLAIFTWGDRAHLRRPRARLLPLRLRPRGLRAPAPLLQGLLHVSVHRRPPGPTNGCELFNRVCSERRSLVQNQRKNGRD